MMMTIGVLLRPNNLVSTMCPTDCCCTFNIVVILVNIGDGDDEYEDFPVTKKIGDAVDEGPKLIMMSTMLCSLVLSCPHPT